MSHLKGNSYSVDRNSNEVVHQKSRFVWSPLLRFSRTFLFYPFSFLLIGPWNSLKFFEILFMRYWKFSTILLESYGALLQGCQMLSVSFTCKNSSIKWNTEEEYPAKVRQIDNAITLITVIIMILLHVNAADESVVYGFMNIVDDKSMARWLTVIIIDCCFQFWEKEADDDD